MAASRARSRQRRRSTPSPGRPPEEYGIEPTSFDEIRAGSYDVDERVKDMDANGVLGSMCFPSFPQFCGQLFARTEDKDVALAMLQAYNDWHIEDWCGAYPGRFIPLRAARDLGPRGAGRRGAPHRGQGRPRRHLLGEPVQARLAEHPLRPLGPVLDGVLRRGRRRLHAHRVVVAAGRSPRPTRRSTCLITLTPMNIVQAAADLVWSPMLRKFPDLKVALSEGGIGWIPYFLERVDYIYERHHLWTGQDFGDQLPSEVFNEHVITCFIDDRVGIAAASYLDIDNICWECDYPHSDSTWPSRPRRWPKHFDGVSDDDIDRITHLNAMRLFNSTRSA